MLEIHRPYPGVALVVTEFGSILLGVPTDAFKATKRYCTDTGLPFPRVLVAPQKMLVHSAPQFNPEFFLYDFLFIHGAAFKPELAGQHLQLVLDEQQVAEVKNSLRITLTGPTTEELESYRDANGKRLVDQETAKFLASVASDMAIKKDGDPRSLDDMLDILTFDSRGTIHLLDGSVGIQRDDNNGFFIKRGRKQEHVSLEINERVLPYASLPIPTEVQHPLKFGVKPLGTRSGFDLSGPSTGFIIWVDGKVCVYDGPVGTRYLLESQGIACDDISMVVLSHCHEDHMGAFVELVLSGNRPQVFTTEPIYRSALIKLSSYFRMPEARVAEFIDYHRVEPGQPFDNLGATFELFYTVHAIPAVGIKVRYSGAGTTRELVISGDTLHHEGLKDLHHDGLISSDLYERMRHMVPDSMKNDTLYFCDVGESIIHGHPSDWADNPNRVLYYHCPDSDHTRSFGRELACPGQTIELIENAKMVRATPPRLMLALDFLDVDDPKWLNRFIDEGLVSQFKTEQLLVRTGDKLDDSLFVLVAGLLEATDNLENGQSFIRPGEFFGYLEHLDGNGQSTSTIRALCPSEVLQIPVSLLTEYIEAFDLNDLLPIIKTMRPFVDSTHLFYDLKVGQRNLLARQASQESYVKGSIILEKGSSGNYFYILLDGSIAVHQNNEIIAEVDSESSENYFGVTSALKPGSPRTTSIVAASNVHLLRLPTQTIRNLFNEDMAIRYNLTVTLDSRLNAKK